YFLYIFLFYQTFYSILLYLFSFSSLTKACFNTSSKCVTGTKVKSFLTLSGISSISFSFSLGIIIVFKLERCALKDFSLRPPIGKTRPLKVISPVIPTFLLTGVPVSDDISAVAIVIPADGPSLGVAPSGT